jgi:hypothetical protein
MHDLLSENDDIAKHEEHLVETRSFVDAFDDKSEEI